MGYRFILYTTDYSIVLLVSWLVSNRESTNKTPASYCRFVAFAHHKKGNFASIYIRKIFCGRNPSHPLAEWLRSSVQVRPRSKVVSSILPRDPLLTVLECPFSPEVYKFRNSQSYKLLLVEFSATFLVVLCLYGGRIKLHKTLPLRLERKLFKTLVGSKRERKTL